MMVTKQLSHCILVSTNLNKQREISNALNNQLSIDLYPGALNIVEDATTFTGNAIKKVVGISHEPNTAYIADDSGLCVDALNDNPGVLSARYGGSGLSDADRCDLLLRNLGDQTNRRAKFVCVIALRDTTGTIYLFDGYCHGYIAMQASGMHGFGYDPIFIPDNTNSSDPLTLAMLSTAEKLALSHRGAALRKLLAHCVGGAIVY